METVRTLEVAPAPAADESPLAHARLHRQLTVDEAARRAGLEPDEVQWLEEGRLYRFPSPDRALLATVLYATALGIDRFEACELAGIPTPPRPFVSNPWRRLGAVGAIGLAVLAAAYLIGSALLWPLGVVAATGGTGLMAIAALRGRVSREHVRAHVSPTLFIYVGALFVLVRAVQDAGVTGALVAGAASHASSASSAAISGLLGSSVLSNLVNNLPGVLVFISGAQAGGVQLGLREPFLFGALAGADLGPNLTPVGALSTMLWLVIVRRRGIEVSTWDFLRLGAVVAPLTLIAAGLLIGASFR